MCQTAVSRGASLLLLRRAESVTRAEVHENPTPLRTLLLLRAGTCAHALKYRVVTQVYLLFILEDKTPLATEAEQTHLIFKLRGCMHVAFT
jgi:hypothetical protein